MNNILEKGKRQSVRTINALICVSLFILVTIFLTGCGDVANINGDTNQSVSSPTVTAIATKVRQSGKNMQAVLGSSLEAFIQYFHRNPDGQDDRSPGKRYEWIVPDVGSDSNLSYYDVTINKDGVVIDVDIIFSHLVKFSVCQAFLPKDSWVNDDWNRAILAKVFATDGPNASVIYQSDTLSKLPSAYYSADQTWMQTDSIRGSATIDMVTDNQHTFSHCDIYLGTS